MTAQPAPSPHETEHDFGHDAEIGALFEEYDRLVRWEERNPRLDARDPIVDRAKARGRIIAFVANTAYAASQFELEHIVEAEEREVNALIKAAQRAHDWMHLDINDWDATYGPGQWQDIEADRDIWEPLASALKEIR